MEFISDSVEKTFALGIQIGNHVNSGDIICITGDLGTGKTHLTKGIAKGMEINDYITSPTFTIVNEYEGRLKLYHFDVYRVNDPEEIAAIGFDEYIFSDSVSVIEWSDYIKELIPEEHMDINISKVLQMGTNFRKIQIDSNNKRYDYIKEFKL